MTKHHGFTLIELIVTLAVFGIVVAAALPNMSRFLDSNRRAANLNSLVSALNLARSEAVKRNNTTSVCIRNSAGTGCDATTSNWEGGWLVFVDGGTPGTLDGTDVILRVYDAIFKRPTPLDVSLRVIPGAPKFITYQPDGRTNTTITTFTRCDDGGQTQARAVIVAISGRVRLSKDSDSNNIHENGTNTDLLCP